MFNFTLVSNIILFFFFIPLYIVFYSSIDSLFIVLAFHILFAIYVAYTANEFTTNPNYSGSHLVGSSIGMSVAILIFAIMYHSMDVAT